ncbi:MAG: type II secretion system protein N, partial [Pseudomonadota bacterium]
MNTLGATSMDGMRQLAGHPVAQALQRRGPAVALVLLTVLIAWLLAKLIWLLIPGTEEAPIDVLAPATSGAPADAEQIRAGVDVSPIIDAHLFGVAVPEPEQSAVVEEEVVDAPETDLPLKLKGTLAGDPAEASLAIIADGNQEKLYTVVGDSRFIRNGVSLHSVHGTYVVINRNGKLETLSLPTASESPPARQPVRRRTNLRRAPASTRNITQVITENATQFTQIVQPRPYFVAGKQKGYRLYPGRD